MFKVASLNGNGANQTLLSMNNLVEGNIHGGVINNTTGTKQNINFIVGTVKFPLSVEALLIRREFENIFYHQSLR